MTERRVDFSTLPIGELPITDYLHVRREIEKQRMVEKKIRLTKRYLRQYQRDYYMRRKERRDETVK